MEQNKLAFVVDDEAAQRMMMEDYLSKYSWLTVKSFATGEECVKNMHLDPDFIFLDYNFDLAGKNVMNGIETLNAIKGQNLDTAVVMMSAQDSIEVALNTVNYGAFDYVVKNESAFNRLDNAIANILSKQSLKDEAKRYKRIAVIFGVIMVAAIISIIILLNSAGDFHFYGGNHTTN
jgi:two-component system, OmpR family, response regulator